MEAESFLERLQLKDFMMLLVRVDCAPTPLLAGFPRMVVSVTKVAPSHGRFSPHFIKGEDRIYLYGSKSGLVSIRFDGTDEKYHLKVTGEKVPGTTNPINASLVLRSPNKQQALALVNNNLYLVKVPLAWWCGAYRVSS